MINKLGFLFGVINSLHTFPNMNDINKYINDVSFGNRGVVKW